MPETILFRAASLAPASFSRSAGTVAATLSTGAPVRRQDHRGAFLERLSVLPGAMTLRTPKPPVLDSHQRGSISHVLGHVSDIRAEGGGITGVLHISRADTLDMIERGDLSAISVGYTVSGWSEAANGAERTATAWQLHEVSLVAEGADIGAILRSETDMPEPTVVDPGTAPAPPPVPPPGGATQSRAEVTAATRALAVTLGLPATWADGQVDAGADLLTMRSAALAEVEKRGAAAGAIRVHQVGDSADDPGTMRTRMAEALSVRMAPSLTLSEPARPYAAMAMADMARMLLIARGESGVQFMPAETVLQRALLTTGDIPQLLLDSGTRVLLQKYAAAPNVFKMLARQVTSTDFRTRSNIRLGEMALLARVPESGEVTSGGIATTSESYKLETYARTFGLTRQAIINDDLSAFADINAAMGLAAAETEASLLVALFVQGAGLGPTMSDGIRLFNIGHGNVAAAGTAITVPALSAGRAAMRTQKGVDGVSPISASAKYLLVSPAKETEAEQLVAAIYAATPATANPFSGRIEVICEPRLSGNSWYLFADPAVFPIMEYSYLASAPGPQLMVRNGFDVMGTEWRVHLDFGAGIFDAKGVYRNAGA